MNPRVLTVLPDFPLPATTGLHLRMVGNLEAVASIGADSRVLWFSTSDRSFEEVDPAVLDARCDGHRHAGARVEQHELSSLRRALAKVVFASAGVFGRPRGTFPYSMRYDAAGAAAKIAAEVERVSPDVVVIPSQGMHWIDALPASVAVVIDAADVLTDVTERLARTHAGSFVGRLGLWANHLACKAQERRYIGLADEVWATTEREAERFRTLAPNARVVVVPNTVPSAPEAEPVAAPSQAGGAFGMIATWSYRPNEDAARRLVDSIAPRVLANSNARLVLAGKDLPDDLVRRCADHPQIEYLGAVDDLDSFYDAVDVVTIPLAVRGGVPLKLAESLARRRPVVASPELVDGLELIGGHDVLVRADDAAWASAIEHLLNDGAARIELVERGVLAHRRCFSVERLERSLREESLLCR